VTLRVAVWGTGNMGRAGIRAVLAHPELALAAVVGRSRAGEDAGVVADVGPLLLPVTADVGEVLDARPDAVVYMASGDVRPDAAAVDIARCLRAGAVVVTPSLYALYDPASAPAALLSPLQAAAQDGGAALFVSGIDPGWGNDVLPLLLSGIASTVEQVRCVELFDYSTYDQPEAVRTSVGMGRPMTDVPIMVAPGVPTMIWGGQLRLMARGLGLELDDVVEHVERRALEQDVTNAMGLFEAGTQGGLRFEVQGIIGGVPRLVIEHVTRIDAAVAPDWPSPADGGAGAHKVVIEGRPRIEVTVEATDEDDNRAAGGNATAAARLVNAIPWLRAAAPGVYDALDVPLTPAVGRVGR
jgi:hypothetical protein